MEIRDLKYLAAAVNTGNFGRAAKFLGVETSTISRRIARLEDELGLALFERSNTGVHLTAGGKAVMVHVNRTLAEFDAVGRSASQNGLGHAGEIRLGVRMPPVGEPLGSLLAGWRVRHPNVVLTIVEMNEPSMAMALEHRRLDMDIVVELHLELTHFRAKFPLRFDPCFDLALAVFSGGHGSDRHGVTECDPPLGATGPAFDP